MSKTYILDTEEAEILPVRKWNNIRGDRIKLKDVDFIKWARVYKVHGGPNFFPTIQIWTRISSLHIILIFASRPLNKGKNCIFIAFLR